MPPSPASVCSSAQEDFWRLIDHPSPLSTPDLTPRDEYTVPQVFREISSNLNGKKPYNFFYSHVMHAGAVVMLEYKCIVKYIIRWIT